MTQHTAGKWTVTPFLTPDRDDDPLGVYCVEPISTSLQNRFDSVSPLDQDNEQEEMDAIHAENGKIARLLEAAPDLLAALKFLLKQSTQLSQQITHDGLENCDAIAKARQAINKAEGGN